MGVSFDDPILDPLFAAAEDPNGIVRVAAARALLQLKCGVPQALRMRSAVREEIWKPLSDRSLRSRLVLCVLMNGTGRYGCCRRLTTNGIPLTP
jgi:hypothetical protein